MRAVATIPEGLHKPHPMPSVPAGEVHEARTRLSRFRLLGLVLPSLLLFDAALITGGYLAALRLTPAAYDALRLAPDAITSSLTALFVILAASFLVLGGMFGLYGRRLLLDPRTAVSVAGKALFWSGSIAVVFGFLIALDPPGDFRRLLLTHTACLALGVLTIRPLAGWLLLRLAEVGPIVPRRVLVIGSDHDARRRASTLEGRTLTSRTVIGLADTAPLVSRPGQRWPRYSLNDWSEIVPLAEALAVDEILIATPGIGRGEAVDLAAELSRRGLETQVVPHLTRLLVDAAPIHRENGVPLLRLARVHSMRAGAIFKRSVDLILASSLLLILSPLMLIIAALVFLTSRGPVFYAQERVGRGGRSFRMFKFRSMVVSNDDSGHRRYVTSLLRDGDAASFDRSGRPIYKIADDPRITWLGKLLRRTSLDELPQLLNVLRGEMSLTGPRPCLPFEYELYESWQKRRLDVTPGMTGLWQVSGRSFLSFEEMVLLDLYYVANWSFLLDLKILWRTIPEVLFARGAR